jgi:hypothetical protein
MCCVVSWEHQKLPPKKGWFFVEAIASLHVELIRFEDRFNGWNGKSQCLLSVDGVDCRVRDPWPFDADMWSHKFNDSSYSYEVAIGLFNGLLLCWINGPDKPKQGDKHRFCEEGGLAEALEDWECVEADRGYLHNFDGEDPDKDANARKLMVKSMYHNRDDGHDKSKKS